MTEHDTHTLRSCPVCGGVNQLVREVGNHNGYWEVYCMGSSVYACGLNTDGKTAEHAINHWNTRDDAALTAARAEADALRGEVERLKEDAGMFCAIHATSQADIAGYPSGHISAHFYDMMTRYGTRMDQFTRVDDGTSRAAQVPDGEVTP